MPFTSISYFLPQVDVIGQTVRDLLHPDDEELVSRFLDVNNLGKQGIFVVRMKSTLAATVRSQEKVEYKVCMRGDVKDFIVL